MKTMKSLKILLIDDEPSVRSSLRIGLESASYQIDEASSGAEALEKVKRSVPDLIVLDLGLGDMEGRDVLTSLRSWSNAPVLVLSVRDSDQEKVMLLDAGADDYLTKPFSLTELMARLRVLERRSQQGAATPAAVKFGDLEINFLEQTVRKAGSDVKLTATEFHLLRILAQASGKVVTQKTLLSEVWGDVGLENPHYVRIYIGQLRKKLEANPSLPKRILTEPGAGYRFSQAE